MKCKFILLAFMALTFCSSISAQTDTTAKTDSSQSTTQPFSVASVAEFPGGNDSLARFISSNLVYPEDALENDVYGTIHLVFIIDKDGNVTDVEVDRMKIYKEQPTYNKRGRKKGTKTVEITDGYDYCLGTCAANLMSNSPKWKPATQRDKNVNMRFRLPIKYHIF